MSWQIMRNYGGGGRLHNFLEYVQGWVWEVKEHVSRLLGDKEADDIGREYF